MRKKNGLGAGFTLIELLVVITVIGLLASILVPSIAGALKGSKKARAMAQISDLNGAVKRYFAEYGKMPVPAGDNGGPDQAYTGSAQAAVLAILIGLDTTQNPKQLVFLDLDPVTYGVKTVAEMHTLITGGGAYKDPWGNDYGILMDLNFDERISALGGFPEIRAKVAVYSGGEKNNTADPPYKTW